MIGCLILLGILLVILTKLIQKLSVGKNNSKVCLVGKTAIVTGGNSGIGYETVLDLASRGCKVIIADIVNSESTCKKITEETGNPNIFCKFLDLASLKSVRKFAQEINDEELRLDILINNAGCAALNDYTEDGILKVMQVNFLGPFLLTHLLLDLLKKNPNGRIVFVSSALAFTHSLTSAKDINELPLFQQLALFLNYSNSKFCLVVVTKLFGEKLKKYGIICTSVHPGLVDTPIYTTAEKEINVKDFIMMFVMLVAKIMVKTFGKSATEGAQTTLYCALSQDLHLRHSGKYFVDCIPFLRPPLVHNNRFCKEVWEESEKLVQMEESLKLNYIMVPRTASIIMVFLEALYYMALFKVFTKLTAAECKSMVNLAGKTALITGGNSGIGYSTAINLASRGCRIILADVIPDRTNRAELSNITRNKNVLSIHLDLSSLESIRRFADHIKETENRIDILINNAGMLGPSGVYTNDGLLKTMQVNSFGHFLLMHLLMDLLKQTPHCNVVFVTSLGAFLNRVYKVEHINHPPDYRSFLAQNIVEYFNASFCQLVVSNCFAELLQGTQVNCNAVHPGIVKTNFYKRAYEEMGYESIFSKICFKFFDSLVYMYGKNLNEGAQTLLHCALLPPHIRSGKYFVENFRVIQPPDAQMKSFRWTIWNEIAKLVKLKPEERIL